MLLDLKYGQDPLRFEDLVLPKRDVRAPDAAQFESSISFAESHTKLTIPSTDYEFGVGDTVLLPTKHFTLPS